MSESIRAVDCPSCGAPITIPDDGKRFFPCKFCGTTLEDQTTTKERETGQYPKVVIHTESSVRPSKVSVAPAVSQPSKPWGWIILILVLVLIAMVASIYLNISAQAAAVGRDIQSMQYRIDVLDEEIEDLQSEVASLLSAEQMSERVEDANLVPLEGDQLVFITIPGYVERQPVVMAPYSNRAVVGARQLPPEYTESLFDWLIRQTQRLSYKDVGVQP